MSETAEELRIIAKDGGRLSVPDCALIARAADELESATALLIKTQAAMLEAQAKQIATAEALLELRPKPAPAGVVITYRWGWRQPLCL